MNTYLTIEEIRKAYPEKWVLLGEPKIESAEMTFEQICSKVICFSMKHTPLSI